MCAARRFVVACVPGALLSWTCWLPRVALSSCQAQLMLVGLVAGEGRAGPARHVPSCRRPMRVPKRRGQEAFHRQEPTESQGVQELELFKAQKSLSVCQDQHSSLHSWLLRPRGPGPALAAGCSLCPRPSLQLLAACCCLSFSSLSPRTSLGSGQPPNPSSPDFLLMFTSL